MILRYYYVLIIIMILRYNYVLIIIMILRYNYVEIMIWKYDNYKEITEPNLIYVLHVI